MSRILLVEDEEGLSGAIREWLEDEYYVVDVASDGVIGLDRLSNKKYELILLDWMLPGMSGIELCKKYRGLGGKVPILILTAKTTLAAKEEGLDSGADDYLTKPFNMRELSARVRALLRRPQTQPQLIITAGYISLDINARAVSKDGLALKLLPKEFILLEVLMRHKGQVLSSDDLIDRVWGTDSDVVQETLRSHVKALRKKIDKAEQPSIITTIHGMGYKIE